MTGMVALASAAAMAFALGVHAPHIFAIPRTASVGDVILIALGWRLRRSATAATCTFSEAKDKRSKRKLPRFTRFSLREIDVGPRTA